MSDKINETREVDENRRRTLKVLASTTLAAGAAQLYSNPVYGQVRVRPNVEVETSDAGLRLRFFTPAEYATVGVISEMIMPTDEHSPGARAAGVPAFIDLLLSETSAETKLLWRTGIAALEQSSQKSFNKNFTDATSEQRIELLTFMSRNEFKPTTLEERFFVAAKTLTIDAYYTSEIGIHQDLKYTGNNYRKEFPGCTHAEHQQT